MLENEQTFVCDFPFSRYEIVNFVLPNTFIHMKRLCRTLLNKRCVQQSLFQRKQNIAPAHVVHAKSRSQIRNMSSQETFSVEDYERSGSLKEKVYVQHFCYSTKY